VRPNEFARAGRGHLEIPCSTGTRRACGCIAAEFAEARLQFEALLERFPPTALDALHRSLPTRDGRAAGEEWNGVFRMAEK